MARITFQKRQKEMKRLEKQRVKAERRAQRKLAKQEGENPQQQEQGQEQEQEIGIATGTETQG